MVELVADVFKTIGQPTITYVKRDSGKFEKDLNDALNERGQLCLITGPSKTGKTTLYKEVLAQRQELPLIVRCDRKQTTENIWKQALEEVNFSRVSSRTKEDNTKIEASSDVKGELGWHWLAKASGKFGGKAAREWSDEIIRDKVLADPGPDLLIPILKDTTYVLVIEDFHYLLEEEQVTLFQ